MHRVVLGAAPRDFKFCAPVLRLIFGRKNGTDSIGTRGWQIQIWGMCKAAIVSSEVDHEVSAEADTELVDAFVVASRALVGIVARSLAGAGRDVTLPSTGHW